MAQHRTRSENILHARLMLVVVFIVLRAVDFCMFHFCYEANLHAIITIIIIDSLWSVALLTAAWLRQAWGRYLMVSLLLFCLAVAFVFTGNIQTFFADNYKFVISTFCAGYIFCAIVLIASQSIQKLTSRNYG